MSRQDAFDRTLAALHDAAFDEAHWPLAAALIDEACGSTAHEVIVGEGFGDDARIYLARFYHRGQRREDLERAYFGLYHSLDERLPRLRLLPAGKVVHVADLYTADELKTSRAYNEGLRLTGAQNALNVRLDGPAGTRIVWAFADSVDPSGWVSAQVEMVQRLVPHIRYLVRVRHALFAAEALGASLSQLLSNTRIGTVYLDWRGRIVETNDRALDLLRRGEGLLDQGGFLRARLAAEDARLWRLLQGALPATGHQAAGGSMTVSRCSMLPRLALHVTPIKGHPQGFDLWRVAAVVLIIESGGQSHVDPGLVAMALGLTPAESRVAALVAGGYSVRDIARLTGRRESTVRTHLKRIFSKQGVSGQADLVRVILSRIDIAARRD